MTQPAQPANILRRLATTLALGALLLPAAQAATPDYLHDTPPTVAPEHQKRLDSAWEKSGEGRAVATTCGFFGALVENPFGGTPLSPQKEAEARVAQEICYVQGFSRTVHFFLATQPDQCNRLSNRLATAHDTALTGLDNEQRQALGQQLDANIGDLVRQHCPREADLILDQ